MAYPSLTFSMLLPAAVRQEFDQFTSLLQGYLSTEHTDTGAHGDVTATSVTTPDVTAGRVASFRGTAGIIPTVTPTTIYTLPPNTPGAYFVFTRSLGNGSANYTACADVLSEGSDARITANNGALMTITLAGMNIQVTQNSGVSIAVQWTILQIA